MWVGITGRNGSGKDSVAQILEELGFIPVSTSDIIRQEVALRKLPSTRDSIRLVIEGWRREYGADILVRKILEQHANTENVVVFSLRHPDEIKTLRHNKKFLLINVVTDDTIRFQRACLRNRENPPQTLEAYLADEAYEAERADKRYFDIPAVEAMADIIVENNGTFDQLRQTIMAIFAKPLPGA